MSELYDHDPPPRLLRDLGLAPFVPEGDVPLVEATHRRTAPSPRELDVLRCWAVGLTNEMAAETMGVAAETVKTLGARARFLLRAKNQTHAVANAIRQGLI